MQDTTIEEQKQYSRHHSNLFTYHKTINNWDDFRKTFTNIHFDHTLNAATHEELTTFWRKHLTTLNTDNQRITILVPSKVTKADQPKEQKTNIKPMHKSKGKDQRPNTDVPLETRVIECAMELVKSQFPKLDYDYSSIFLGNDKQLLIYRQCFSIEKYIEKYRLPKNFEKPFEELQELSKDFLELKIKRNKAFSTFDKNKLQKVHKQAQIVQERLKDSINKFAVIFKQIINDFHQKPKCKDLVLNNIPQGLIELLKPLCIQNKVVVTNRFNDCDNDEYKDVIIIKSDDSRLKVCEVSYYEEKKIEYIYVEPVKVPQPPKELRDLIFLKIDIAKQSYKYRVDLPTADKSNPLGGIFIRSQTDSGYFYEQSIESLQGCQNIDVDIFPYKYGKSLYEIYLWNQHGFTKSTQKIVLFNELPLPNTNDQKLKNKNIYVLGQSEAGLSINNENNTDEFVKFSFDKRQSFVRDISLGNAAVVCDVQGDVAGWGEMYFPQQEQKKEQEMKIVSIDNELANLKIQNPCLLLGGKQIRKVSCGMGYFLMLSTFGSMFSMGFNQFGQLGQGDFNMNIDNINPKEICKFTNTASPFITDIHATICGASFAINQGGQLYRWGFNQVDQTTIPIYDRFNSVINYTTSSIFYKCCNPTRVGISFIQGFVKQVEGGNNFYFARNEQGVLYGWGQCRFLGIKPLLDKNEKQVYDIINPIQVMKNIKYITVGFNHCVAITMDHRIIAWGNSAAFTNKNKQSFCQIPIDVTEEYGGRQNIKIIKAGHDFTAMVTKQNIVKIMGTSKGFNKDQYDPKVQITDLACSYEPFIAILGEPIK